MKKHFIVSMEHYTQAETPLDAAMKTLQLIKNCENNTERLSEIFHVMEDNLK
jgi:hypothetical protein